MTQISSAAREFRRRVADEAAFLETCDGGDAGSPARPSIWLMGIEPGWSLSDEKRAVSEGASARLRQYPIDLQLGWRFNQNAFKLLAALDGQSPDEYRTFAKRAQPFVAGSTGYFKGNLFPEPFHKVKVWDAEAVEATGFSTKAEYQAWMRGTRFPVFKNWLKSCRPRLFIGVGSTFLFDFLHVTETQESPEEHRFEVNGHTKRVFVASGGLAPVAVIPHLSGGSNGLNGNLSIQRAAEHIRSKFEL